MPGETIYTVSNVNRYIGRMFENSPVLDRIRVKGEVTECKYHGSGHLYFALKDGQSQLQVALFANRRAGLTFRLEDGMEVVVSGSVRAYEPRGTYSLIATEVKAAGVGALYEQFERMRRELEAQGYFDETHKKPLPPFVQVLGVVTSASGEAIGDITRVTRDRNPHVEILLCPAQVQGEGAAESIVEGIHMLDGLCDCMIVGRGGGSYEDLQAFNDRRVAEAVYACETPVVSAVGHEYDVTIIDLVADVRAATPTDAAGKAVWLYREYAAGMAQRRQALNRRMERALDAAYDRAGHARERLRLLHPKKRIGSEKDHLERIRTRLSECMERQLERRQREARIRAELTPAMEAAIANRRHRLEVQRSRLAGFAPERRLAEGMAYVTDAAGKSVGAASLMAGSPVRMLFADGTAAARVTEVTLRKEDGHDE